MSTLTSHGARILMVSATDAPDGFARVLRLDGQFELIDFGLSDGQLAAKFHADEVIHVPGSRGSNSLPIDHLGLPPCAEKWDTRS